VITRQALWAKLERDDVGRIVGWHSLVDHSADVAAVVEALLVQPTLHRRLAATAGRPDLDQATIARLAALSFLHDIGKANRGFRARVDARAELVGHIEQLAWVFYDDRFAGDIREHMIEVLGLDRIVEWFEGEALDFLGGLCHGNWLETCGSVPGTVGIMLPLRPANRHGLRL
jgi:CRISPR-associated endonuclease/helicase Cas3